MSNSSSVPDLILAASMAGAVLDWRYVRAGGKRSSRKDKILFWSITLAVALSIAAVEYLGGDPFGILGYTVVPLIVVLFGAWELGRWRMRRKFPLARAAEQM
jgi:hypothetical protein